MVSFHDLVAAKPQAWLDAGVAWNAVAVDATQAYVDLMRESKAITEYWKGESSRVATGELAQESDKYNAASSELLSVKMILNGLGSAAAYAQQTLKSALSYAKRNGLHVDENGTVHTPAGSTYAADGSGWGPASDPLATQAQQASGLIMQALAGANRADQQSAAMLKYLSSTTGQTNLDKVRNGDMGQASAMEVNLLAAAVPPAGSDPALVAAWWNGLTPQQRAQLEQAVPVNLAQLKGLPPDVYTTVEGQRGSFSSLEMVKEAEQHWKDPNDLPGGGDDCADFASDMLKKAGLRTTSSGLPSDHYDDGSWTDDDGTEYLGKSGKTRTWTESNAFYHYMTQHGGTEVTSGPAGSIDPSKVRPGDVIVWTQNGPNPGSPGIGQGEAHHVAVVTAVTPDGDIKTTQHNVDLLNSSLTARETDWENGDGEFRGDGGQIAHVIRPGGNEVREA